MDKNLDVSGQAHEQVGTSLAGKRDSLFREAVTHVLGYDDWTPADMGHRCGIAVLPNKVEVFTFDGQALIEFMPVSFESTMTKTGHKITASRQYRKLY